MPTAEHGFPRLYRLGGVEVNDLAIIRQLHTESLPITSNRYDILQTNLGADYVVPAGKTLYITRVIFGFNVAAASSVDLRIYYGDDAVTDSAAAPTNAKLVAALAWRTATGQPLAIDCLIPIPAGKYPHFLSGGGAGQGWVEGIEV